MPSQSEDTERKVPKLPRRESYNSITNRFLLFADFFRQPKSLFEVFVSVDLSALWRRHLVWAKKDGGELLSIVTARFQSTAIVLSLLVSAEIGTFFSPSRIVTEVRTALREDQKFTLEFWTGIVLMISIFFSVAALIANFTAWSIFSGLSKQNAAIILRSSIGVYAAQLPNRLVVATFYLFFAWTVMFWWIVSGTGAIVLTATGSALIIHIAITYSAMGRIIMATSAMGSTPIIPKEEEEELTPVQLSALLLNESRLACEAKIPVNRQYRRNVAHHDALSITYAESVNRRHPDVFAES